MQFAKVYQVDRILINRGMNIDTSRKFMADFFMFRRGMHESIIGEWT